MSLRFSLGNWVGYILVTAWDCFNKFNYQKHVLSVYMHNPEEAVFESVILYLQKKGFHFISTEELSLFFKQKHLPFGKNAVITLDDAWRSNLDNVLPVVEKHQVPITIFTPIQPIEDGVMWLKWFRDKSLQVQFPELYQDDPKKLSTTQRNIMWNKLKSVKQFDREMMTVDEIKTLASNPLITIGGHTYTHPILPNCNIVEMEFELVAAREKLRDITKTEANVMAYPNGDFNETVVRTCKRAGYNMAFTTEGGRFINIEQSDLMLLPRNCVPNAYGKWESIARALGIWQKMFSK